MKAAEEKGVKPFEIPVAVDAIVPIVNPKNSLKNLSLDDLRKIYKGEIKNWKEVGGPMLRLSWYPEIHLRELLKPGNLWS